MIEDIFKNKDYVEKYLAESQHCLSAFSFINIFSWQEFYDFEFKELDGHLCIFAKDNLGVFQYLPPLGKQISVKAIEQSFQYMQECNGDNGITRIENVEYFQRGCFDKYKYNFYNKGYEYCYYKKDIAALRGNRYKSKRSEYNVCVNNNACQYLSFDDGMLEECEKLYEAWACERKIKYGDEIYQQMLDESQKVHSLVLKHFKVLGLVGRVVSIEGKIKAYTFGFPISYKIFCVLFEVTDLSIKGLAAYIFREFCRDKALKGYSFINVMDDFECQNIKKIKMSFRPVLLFPSYGVRMKEV